MRILVVDNDRSVVETFKSAIRAKTQHAVEVGCCGKEAIEKMKESEPFDLLILDVMMPDISGIDVCKMMLQDEKMKNIPVLLVSALPVASPSFQDSIENFSELSVVKGVLEKPFTLDELMSKVNSILLAKKME